MTPRIPSSTSIADALHVALCTSAPDALQELEDALFEYRAKFPQSFRRIAQHPLAAALVQAIDEAMEATACKRADEAEGDGGEPFGLTINGRPASPGDLAALAASDRQAPTCGARLARCVADYTDAPTTEQDIDYVPDPTLGGVYVVRLKCDAAEAPPWDVFVVRSKGGAMEVIDEAEAKHWPPAQRRAEGGRDA